MKPIIILFCIAAASAGVTHAGLYKCSVNGKVIYQDIPCMGGKQIEVKPAPKVSVEDAQAAEIRLYKDRLWINRQAAEEQMARQRSRLEAASNNLNRTLQDMEARNEKRSTQLKNSNCKLMEAAAIRAEKRALTSRSYADSQTAQGMRGQYMTLCR